MIKALIFDLDGTLFDNTPANVKAYTEAFKQANISFDASRYQELFGLRFKEMIDAIAPKADEEARNKIRALKVDFYRQSLSLVRPNEGLLALLRSSREHYKTALATTASRVNVLNLLSHFNVEIELFDVLITGEDVQNGKPDPECYNKAINILGVRADECCVFEDSEVGMTAATKAGARVVRVVI